MIAVRRIREAIGAGSVERRQRELLGGQIGAVVDGVMG
jgi:hypothetical protein